MLVQFSWYYGPLEKCLLLKLQTRAKDGVWDRGINESGWIFFQLVWAKTIH